MAKVVDDLGLVPDNRYLTVIFPGDTPVSAKALVFRVVFRHNQGREIINYGAIPFVTTDVLPTYDGSSGSPVANGRVPSRSYTNTYMTFGRTALSSTLNVYDTNDIFYLPDEFNERLFHVQAYFYPEFLRVGLEIPAGTKQDRFQRERVIGGVGTSLGWRRGNQEVVIFPELRVGWQFGNDTELDAYTGARFVFGEYLVKIPDDPDIIWRVLSEDEESHRVKLPIAAVDPSVNQAMTKSYGFTGFDIQPKYKKAEALASYKTKIGAIKAAKPTMLG
jgi:hypothetical protein